MEADGSHKNFMLYSLFIVLRAALQFNYLLQLMNAKLARRFYKWYDTSREESLGIGTAASVDALVFDK